MAMEIDPRTGTAVLFPGIGPSSFPDAAKFLLIDAPARELLAHADDVLGYSLLDAYRTSEEEYGDAARVAFLVTCLALAGWAEKEYGIRPEICAGASFGGTPAAVRAGALSFPDAVRLTAQWGRCIREYFEREHRDVVTQSVARTSPEKIRAVLAELAEKGEWAEVACRVDDDFFMVSVRERNVEGLQHRLRAEGSLPLYVMRPPMHSPAFAPLRERVESDVFGGVAFTDPAIPVVSDHDGTVLTTGDGIRTLLLDATVRQVHWPEVVATLRRLGVGKAVVAGQDALWGRVGCVTGNFEVVPVKPTTALRPRRRAAVA
uniref:[acyl-carrier-protein] S-malonyltransferase n=1 Tax=Streptomyces sp. MJ635-86F5 TaxID=1321967 RepID=X5IYZ3_9ACTN|nr:acyltransferase [Streptomyces sp. MJ635-86F5]